MTSELDDVKDAHYAAMQALASGGTVIIELQLRVNRLAQACLRYRDVVDRLVQEVRQDTPDADELIADAERGLTDDDRTRIG